MRLPEGGDVVFMRGTRVQVTGPVILAPIVRMMIDRAVTGIQDQLQECMRVRIDRAGAHLHGEQEEDHENRNADEREPPARVSSLRSWRGCIEDVPETQHRVTRWDLCRTMIDATTVSHHPSHLGPVRLS